MNTPDQNVNVIAELVFFSARVKKGHRRDEHSCHRGAHSKQTDEMKRWVSDYLIAKPKSGENVIPHTRAPHESITSPSSSMTQWTQDSHAKHGSVLWTIARFLLEICAFQ